MPQTLSAQEGITYSREKQVVEAQLAKALYHKFNQGTALSNLQKLAKRCIEAMAAGDPRALLSACQIENKLCVWRKIGFASPVSLRAFGRREHSEEAFDASDVSDIIRLFGQWVEGDESTTGGNAQPGPVGAKENDAWNQSLTPSFAVKDAYRPGVMVNRTGADSWKNEVENVWADGKGRFKGAASRRDRGKGWPVEGYVDLRQNNAEFAGIQGKRAKDDSNVLKIDRMFGLLIGADISGTTADTVFALEMLGRDFLSAAYYILPLATIVYNNHHTLLEVALALSLNGVIDYEVGFYTSLMPDSVKTPPRELAGITGLLEQYERDARNRCFVLYYSNNLVAGGYLFSQAETDSVRPFLKAKDLIKDAPRLPRYPTKEGLDDYFKDALSRTSFAA